MKQVVTTWTCEQCKKMRVDCNPPAFDKDLDLIERMDVRAKARIEAERWLTVTGGPWTPPWEEHYCSRKCLTDRLRDAETEEPP